MAAIENLDWLISVDDHVLEPPHLWQRWVPAAYRDRAPKIVRSGEDEWWDYDGLRTPTSGLAAVAGKSKEDFSLNPVRYEELRPGTYDPDARVTDMNRAGILASLCFPSYARFCGQLFSEQSDKELALICIQGYNDWMIEEWCGSQPGRLIPMIILPLWDSALASREVERCAAKGARAVAFSENVSVLGFPSIHDPAGYWDPLWAACNDTEVVVCMHIGSSSQLWAPSDESPQIVKYVMGGVVNISGAMIDWLFSPQFVKYPRLKIALSEGGIGWMPFMLERTEYSVDRHRYWISQAAGDLTTLTFESHTGTAAQMGPDLNTMDVREVFRDHIFGCFINDPHGLQHIHDIGVDNVMIETDYPHADSTWPDCIEFALGQLDGCGLSGEEKYKILRGNAERVFRFEPAQLPAPSKV